MQPPKGSFVPRHTFDPSLWGGVGMFMTGVSILRS